MCTPHYATPRHATAHHTVISPLTFPPNNIGHETAGSGYKGLSPPPSVPLCSDYSPVGRRVPVHHLEGKILRAVLGPQDLPLEGLGCSQAGILSHEPFMTPFMTSGTHFWGT